MGWGCAEATEQPGYRPELAGPCHRSAGAKIRSVPLPFDGSEYRPLRFDVVVATVFQPLRVFRCKSFLRFWYLR